MIPERGLYTGVAIVGAVGSGSRVRLLGCGGLQPAVLAAVERGGLNRPSSPW